MEQLPLLKIGALPLAAGSPPEDTADWQQQRVLTQKKKQKTPCSAGNLVVDLSFGCSTISFRLLLFNSVYVGVFGREGANLNVYTCCLSLQKTAELISRLP